MSEERDLGGGEEAQAAGDDAVQTKMQLFSTWEVRKVPANCVSRLCTLTVTRLETLRCLEPGLASVVLAVSMKTPHRSLRSNEFSLPPSGLLDIPLQLTFSLQYPHFVKRGGNVLQVRLQRRKRYRNRPMGGYKTLATGTLEMAQVLQRSFVGVVRLYHEKQLEHVVAVTVGSLSSTPGEFQEQPSHLAEASSDEDEDDIFSDELGERQSDSESGDNMEHSSFAMPDHKSKTKLKAAAVLRLLKLHPRTKGDMALTLGLPETEGEDRETAISFASSISDSEEEEEELTGGDSPSKPMLSPFFGSDRCSMISLPTSSKASELASGRGGGGGMRDGGDSGGGGSLRGVDEQDASWNVPPLKKHGSLEQAIRLERIEPLPSIFTIGGESSREWDLERGRGRVWVGGCEESSSAQELLSRLEGSGEVTVMCEGVTSEGVMARAWGVFDSLLTAVKLQWRDHSPLHVVLVGGDSVVSAALQAFVSCQTQPGLVHFSFVPTVSGLFAAKLGVMDEHFLSLFGVDSRMAFDLPDTNSAVMSYVAEALQVIPLPPSEVVLQREGRQEPQVLAFVCNVRVGCPDTEQESPGSSNVEATELVVEYGTGKKEGQKGSVKLRSVLVSCTGQQFSVTGMGRDKRGKGIRIRKKDPEVGGAIVSLNASQLTCRPTSKQDTIPVMVDGVEWEGVTHVRLTAIREPPQGFPLAITMATTTTIH